MTSGASGAVCGFLIILGVCMVTASTWVLFGFWWAFAFVGAFLFWAGYRAPV